MSGPVVVDAVQVRARPRAGPSSELYCSGLIPVYSVVIDIIGNLRTMFFSYNTDISNDTNYLIEQAK